MEIRELPGTQAENTQKSKQEILFSEADQSIGITENTGSEPLVLPDQIRQSIIHFYFCVEGSILFTFSPHYSREIKRQFNYFFYNPDKDMPFQLSLSPGARMVTITLTLEHLHQLFVHDTLPFLKPENVKQKFYDEREIPAPLMVELSQLFNVRLSASAARLYFRGKILELIALYFSERKPDTEACPFLNDQDVVRKIRDAKDHLLRNLNSPPGLRQLCRTVGLNEYQLKAGFKEIYGHTVFGFLLDHKMDRARVLLDSGKLQVSEVAFQIGYANPSHFIAAFKKKFGVTPKKYLMAKA